MMTPPAAGPAMADAFHMTWFSAIAAGRSRRDTMRGVMADWVGAAMPLMAALSPTPR